MTSFDDSFQEAPANALFLRLDVASTLGPDGDSSQKAFEESRRVWFDVKRDGKRIALLETTLAELGYRDDAGDTNDDNYRLPLYIARSLAALFELAPDILWLVLTEPRGPLPSIPWEALLTPWLASALVRYSASDFGAEQFQRTNDSVVCFCSGADDTPADRLAVVDLYLGMLPQEMSDEATIHVFADESTRKLLDKKRVQFYFHEPPAEWTFREPSGARITHPWLQWVYDEMRGKTINFVHVICDGALGFQEGGLAFISPITAADTRTGYPVGARELNTFLDRLGTWSIGFSSPPTNSSVAGLRYLHDQLGESRSGPVLFHDMKRDIDGTALLAGYRFYINGGWATRSGAVSLYWNPSRQKIESERRWQLRQLTPATRLRDLALIPAEAPSWVSSAQRAFEASLSAIGKEPDSERERQIQQGIAAGLHFASTAIAESLERSRGSEASLPEETADANG